MDRFRLINCTFLNESSFVIHTSLKAKMLYLMLFINADDKGFAGNLDNIINNLENSDVEFNIDNGIALLKNDYTSAILELINRGYIYEFRSKYGDSIYVIRHWYVHNKYKKDTRTNYYELYKKLELVNGKYYLRENHLKESNIKEKEINENNLKEINNADEEWNEMLAEINERN